MPQSKESLSKFEILAASQPRTGDQPSQTLRHGSGKSVPIAWSFLLVRAASALRPSDSYGSRQRTSSR